MIVDDDVRALRARARPPLLPVRHRRTRRRRRADHRRRCTPRPGVAHTRGDARLDDARPHVGVHDPGRRPAAGRRTGSTSIRTCATCTGFRPGARRTTCIRTKSSRRATTRRSSTRSCARPARSGRSPRRRRGTRRPRRATAPVELASHHGDVSHGRRPAHERGRSVATLPRRREHGVHRLVGVPDVDRLRPDAHASSRSRSARAATSPACRHSGARDRDEGCHPRLLRHARRDTRLGPVVGGARRRARLRAAARSARPLVERRHRRDRARRALAVA